MIQITEELIRRALLETCIEDQREIRRLIKGFEQKQPYLFRYLQSNAEDDLNGNEQGHLLLLAYICFRVMSQCGASTAIMLREVERIEKENIELFQTLSQSPDYDQEVLQMLERHPQSLLLKSVISAVYEPDREGWTVREQSQIVMLILLKTTIEALAQSVVQS